MNGNATNDPVSFLAEFNAPELLNLLVDGAYITDMERRIVFWNDAARKITGWEAGQVVGHHCKDNLLVHVDKDGHALCSDDHCPLHRCMITGHASSEPMLVFAQHRSGTRVPVEVTVSPVRNHAGQVIGGIEVFRDLTESVQDQLRAKEIQDVAVKCELPPDPRVRFETHYQPRDIVGGDFFRIEKLDEARYAILVADARGHGVAAALYTMLLRSLWHEHRAELASPARFMCILNERLQAVVRDTGYFGTAVLASYHAATGELQVVRAGHPSPLLFRADHSCEAVGTSNPALGLFPTARYQETGVRLQVGDTALLYTDGATELFDSADHELGREGLQELVRGQDPAGASTLDLHKLEGQLLQFTDAIHLPDDLTLVKISRTA
jgi:sigma-B regulation protein RsbU (phosphoserine phosphatase)